MYDLACSTSWPYHPKGSLVWNKAKVPTPGAQVKLSWVWNNAGIILEGLAKQKGELAPGHPPKLWQQLQIISFFKITSFSF